MMHLFTNCLTLDFASIDKKEKEKIKKSEEMVSKEESGDDKKKTVTYKVNAERIDADVESAINSILEHIWKDTGKKISENERKSLRDKLKEFKKDQLTMDAYQLIAKKELDDFYQKYFEEPNAKDDKKPRTLEEYLDAGDARAKKKKYAQNLSIFAGVGIAVIVILLVLSGVCASSTYCGLEYQPVLYPNGTQKVVNEKPEYVMTPKNIPLQILESQFMIALISVVIGPVVVKILKEKYDIDIESSQISMIMTDATKAVRLYQNNANRLRDKDGKIPQEYQTKLRDLAFDSIKTNYSDKKYQSLLSNLGSQVYDKAIESAVKNGWIDRYPLEKKQVEELIKQSIDALPQIVEWKNLHDDVKNAFLDGHLRRLLSTLKVEGWASEQLNEMFDAEVNKRLLAASIADSKKLLGDLATQDKYLKYTSTVLLAVGESLSKETTKSNPS